MSNEVDQELLNKERELLKEEARKIGVSVAGNVSVETLRARIQEKLAEDNQADEKVLKEAKETRAKKRQSKAQFDRMRDKTLTLAERRRAAKKLHRVVITCHDPVEAKTGGRIFTTGNSVFGTERKYVPYGRPWHISTMMLNAIREMKFLTHSIEIRDNKEINRHFETPLYSVNELAPMTQDELEVLSKQQRERAGTD